MATQIINSQLQSSYVEVVITESFLVKRDEWIASCGIHTQPVEPTDDEYLTWALSNLEASNARPLSQRTNWEVINKQEPNGAGAGVWSAQLYQYNIEPSSSIISLQIPIQDLPLSYTDEDIITWGRNAGKLRAAEQMY